MSLDKNFVSMNEDLMRLMHSLRAIRVDSIVDLPQIVVCGDQSTGKSSVLEHITSIPFPKDSNLCTRCATEINLRKTNAPFRAEVSVIVNSEELKKNGFKMEKKILNSLSDIPGEIIRATKDLSNAIGLGESHVFDDIISVEARGSGLVNLTVVDLPGNIRTVSDTQDTALISRIQDLVRSYAKKSRTIVLAVHPCTSDLANCSMREEMKEYDEEGTRTLAVLTKPDRIDSGAEEDWVTIVKGESQYTVGLGFHLLRCRGKKEIGESMTLEQAHSLESDFFNDGVWKDVPEDRKGASSLTKRLSELLPERILASMPAIMEEMKSKLDDVEMELQLLESSYSLTEKESVKRFNSMVNNISDLLNCSIRGDYRGPFFQEDSHRRTMAEFRKLSTTLSDGILSVKTDEKRLKADLVGKLETLRGPELKGMISFTLFAQLFHKWYLKQYLEPCKAFRKDVLELVTKNSLAIVQEAVPVGAVQRLIRGRFDDFKKQFEEHSLEAMNLMFREEGSPSTENYSYFAELMGEVVDFVFQDIAVDWTLTMYNADGIPHPKGDYVVDVRQKLVICTDEVAEEILASRRTQIDANATYTISKLIEMAKFRMKQISSVRYETVLYVSMLQSYAKVSAKRIIDRFVQYMSENVLSHISKEFATQLRESPLPIIRQLEPPTYIRSKFKQLQEKKEILENGIREFGMY